MLGKVDPEEKGMYVLNPFNPIPNSNIVFSMDCKHVIKRIRNNVLVSGDDATSTKLLTWQGYTITWNQWRAAYNWDK